MCNIKFLIIILLILGGLVLIVNQAFLYSDKTTHPYLIEEMIKLYNHYYDPDITLDSEYLKQMKKGSTDEDIWPRNWYNHFYDPVHKRGLPFSAKDWAQDPEAQSQNPGGDHSWQTAISEYNAGYKQKAFYSLGHILHLIEDMAVPAHTREDDHINGEPFEKWTGNLPEDSIFYKIASSLINYGVEPKIFNNLNAYFDEVANFSNNNFFSKDTIKDTIDENTGRLMPSAKYSGPKIVKEGWENGEQYGYGRIGGSSKLVRLVRIGRDPRGNKTYFIEHDLYGDSPEIHADYFSILSKEAVINGAGVIKLFFDSITEPEKEIIEPEKQLSFLQKIGNSISGAVKFVISVVDGLVHIPPSVIDSATQEVTPDIKSEDLVVGPGMILKNTKPESRTPDIETFNINEQETQSEPSETQENIFLVKRVIDGDTIVLENGKEIRYIGIDTPELPNGCFSQEATNKNKELVEGKKVRLEKDVSETDVYGRLLRYVYVDSLFINDYLVRNGYAYDFPYEPDIKLQEQFAKAEEGAKENRRGLWGDICHPIVVQGPIVSGDGGISPAILEETNSGTATSGQEQQNQSLEQSPEEQSGPQDTTPPDIVLNPLVFNYASSSLAIFWSSPEASVSFNVEYKEGQGDPPDGEAGWQILLENTADTQTNFVVNNKDIIYYFRVKGKDLAGNESNWKESSIEILSRPVVINEIALILTNNSLQAEWIELYNRADYDVDLTGWSLKSNDNSPEIIFVSGDRDNKKTVNNIIPAKGYYLLERTNDATTSKPADWYGSFGSGALNYHGETLELKDGHGNQIDLLDNWYAGDYEQKKTMERINPNISGTNSKNWKTYIGTGSQATDSKGNPIFGTPKEQNSVYKLYTAVIENIAKDTVWTKDNSPYLIYDTSGGPNELLEITQGATLTIEPGVIVKFYNPGLKVFGNIKAEGTSDKPIVFTDYNDDSYGGDIPGSSAIPKAGFWSGIWFTSTSTDSILDNVIIRYAGSRTRPFRTGSTYSPAAVGAGIRVENTSIILKNSTIENNLFKGVWLINSSNTIIEKSTFQNHLKDTCPSPCTSSEWYENIALYIDSSSPQIKNSTFQNNLMGIYIDNNSGPIIEDNIFSNNTYPIWVRNSYPQFSDNQIEDNNWDGIVLEGLKLNRDYTLGGGPASPAGGSVFINYDSIPFWSIVVPGGYTLTIEPGTIIKSVYSTSGLLIEGTLIAEGTSEKPIVFTSFYDDEYGGDTNGDGDATKDNAKPGSWGQIVFTPTSTNSILNYVVIRYGGTKWGQSYNFQPDYVLKIEGSSLSLTNSIIENNTSGFRMENSNSYIANTTFQDHRYSSTSTGLYLSSSWPIMDISTFLNNSLGIYIDPSSWLNLIGLVFANNNKDFDDMRPQNP